MKKTPYSNSKMYQFGDPNLIKRRKKNAGPQLRVSMGILYMNDFILQNSKNK